jgi:hypothetical protein
MKDRMKLSLSPKLVEKLVWAIVISLCKIFIPSYTFDGLLCQNWLFLPPLIAGLYDNSIDLTKM